MNRFVPLLFCAMLVFAALSCGTYGSDAPDAETPTWEIAYCYQPISGTDAKKTIHLIRADGSDDRLLMEESIGLNHHCWSPDGMALAAVGYVSQETWSIYTFGADGTGFQRITNIPGVWDSEPAWSPDGERISFTRIFPNEGYREELWMMNADGSDPHSLGLDGLAAQWSPDGDRLIYASVVDGDYDLYTCAPDGSDVRTLTDTPGHEICPCWSPNGSRIAFARSEDRQYRSWEIWIMNADGTGELQLTENRSYETYPKWSPDGSMLSFESDRSGHEHWEIYVMDVDGTNVMRVTQTPPSATAINPVWRPVTEP